MNIVGIDHTKHIVEYTQFAEPKHKEMIDKVECQLKEYEEHLFNRLTRNLSRTSCIEPMMVDIQKAQEQWHEDPLRKHMLRGLQDMKMLFERPLIIIKDK